MPSDSEVEKSAKAMAATGPGRKILPPEQVTEPLGETARNVRRSLEAPFNIAAIGVSLVNQESDDARSVDMEIEAETVDPDARFKIVVRDILNELRDRTHPIKDRVTVQERRLGNLAELDKRIDLLDRGMAARDTAIRRVENDVWTLTRSINNLSVLMYKLQEDVIKNSESNEVVTERVDVLREG